MQQHCDRGSSTVIGANTAGCLGCNACSLGALAHGASRLPLGSNVVDSSAPTVLVWFWFGYSALDGHVVCAATVCFMLVGLQPDKVVLLDARA